MQENNVFVKAPFIQSQSPLQKLSHETAGAKSDIPYANVAEWLQETEIMEYMPYRDDLLIGRGVEIEDMIITTEHLGLDNNHTLSKEEFMSCDNKVRNSYMAVIYKYSLLQPDNIVLQAVCDYAKANVTLACIGAHSEEYIVMSRDGMDNYISTGMSLFKAYVKSSFSPEYRNDSSNVIVAPLQNDTYNYLRADDYNRAYGLYSQYAKIASDRTVNPHDFILQTFADLAESSLLVADLAYNHSKFLYLEKKSVAYLMKDGCGALKSYLQNFYNFRELV